LTYPEPDLLGHAGDRGVSVHPGGRGITCQLLLPRAEGCHERLTGSQSSQQSAVHLKGRRWGSEDTTPGLKGEDGDQRIQHLVSREGEEDRGQLISRERIVVYYVVVLQSLVLYFFWGGFQARWAEVVWGW
jgi:hypothetical protein